MYTTYFHIVFNICLTIGTSKNTFYLQQSAGQICCSFINYVTKIDNIIMWNSYLSSLTINV